MTTENKATFKRDHLKSIEKKMQEKWQEAKVFQQDAPAEGEAAPEKFMATFPYPYMNGKLHLGHAFTASKAEFAVAYQRMLGKKSLYPFGFHCTGMPIKAAADKLRNEMAMYGCPPVVPVEEGSDAGSVKAAKHSKVAAKTGNVKLQWDILKQIGIPEEEIPKFAEPTYWMEFFPPLAQKDLTNLGFHNDWRRSFITTDKNPFYDAFVRWQFNKLRSQNRIKYGKRNTIFSPLDGQPCLDHDRQSGEGVEPKEYTVIKLEVLEWPTDSVFDPLRNHKAYLGAATLRPETMYGQTNCWVGPEIEYGAFKMADGSLIVCTRRAALNMSYQGFMETEGKAEALATFTGAQLMGAALKGPLCVNPKIYVLPMFSVAADKGTGVVTSVPSNSPADYVALKDIKDKENLRKKYNIEDFKVLPFTPIPIIRTEAYGDLSAETVVHKLNIKSQNDLVNLEKAKEMVYKDDFYSGVMIIGSHKGKTVQEAKTLIKDELVAAGEAFIYFEPEGLVISRSGDECVVALVDQWYIDYGEPSWRALADRCLERMNCFSDEVRHQFASTLDWMKQWACSRSFGLGSRLPWDPTYLIESLSDSTIYMAYYTVAHILHEGSLDGSVSPNGIKPEQMTDAVWDWIYGESEEGAESVATSSGISAVLLTRMRNEFRFWYPMDMRVSGKDLVPNHLTFSIYNHVAIFPERFWPLGMRANGHLLLNSQKMSKSTGNFMTIEDAIEEFGADATRLALADAGDSVEDANFLKDTANTAILRLFTQLEWIKEVIEGNVKLRDGSSSGSTFQDRVFAAEMNACIAKSKAAYEVTNYREALKEAFYGMQSARDSYREATVVHGDSGMSKELIYRFIEMQALVMAPITPHWSDYIWLELLGKTTCIIAERYPTADPIDQDLLNASAYLQSVTRNIRLTLQSERAPKKGPAKELDSAEVYVAVSYPKWQEDAIAILKSLYEEGKGFPADDIIVSSLKPLMTQGKPNKKLIPFVMEQKARVLAEGISALNRQLPFDEMKVLNENLDYLTKTIGLMQISVSPVDPAKIEEGSVTEDVRRKQEASLPGVPSAFFFKKD